MQLRQGQRQGLEPEEVSVFKFKFSCLSWALISDSSGGGWFLDLSHVGLEILGPRVWDQLRRWAMLGAAHLETIVAALNLRTG